jgi:hypothetical protein
MATLARPLNNAQTASIREINRLSKPETSQRDATNPLQEMSVDDNSKRLAMQASRPSSKYGSKAPSHQSRKSEFYNTQKRTVAHKPRSSNVSMQGSGIIY